LNISGASNIRGELKANEVIINRSGIGMIELSGSANEVKMDVSGASQVMAEKFLVKKATILSSSAGNIIVNAVDYLKVETSGASSVYYKGSPYIEINSSGLAKIFKK
jgi:hypothetical protein